MEDFRRPSVHHGLVWRDLDLRAAVFMQIDGFFFSHGSLCLPLEPPARFFLAR
jgi:hypothetical protein